MGEKSTNFRVEVGERLRRLRTVKELGQEEVGEIIGMVTSGVSMIEKGVRGLDPEDAARLKRATGVTLDWIYTGDAGSLPKELFKPLTAKAAPVAETPARRQGRK